MSVTPFLENFQPGATGAAYKVPSSVNEYDVLEAVALNAAVGLRTVELPLPHNADEVLVGVFYTDTDSTDVTVTPSGSIDGTNYAEWTSRATASGAGTLSEFVDTNAVAVGANKFLVSYKVAGLKKLKLVIGSSDGDADETVSLQCAVAFRNSP